MPATMRQKHIRLHRAQHNFRQSTVPYRGFVGGRGAGKSWIGAYDLLRRARPNRLYLVGAPTYKVLMDATWRTLEGLAKELGVFAGINKTEMRMMLGNGAEILGRSADEPERFRGPNLSGAWLDEASQMKRDAFDLLIPCLREGGEQGWLSATFTPRGKSHWTYEVFARGGDDGAALFHAKTSENPFLPPEFVQAIRAQYGPGLSLQELEGEFVDLEGAEWPADWFPPSIWFEHWPAGYRVKVMGLDPSKGRNAKFGDYSAYIMLTVAQDGTLYVEADLQRRNIGLIVEHGLEHYRTFQPHGVAIETNEFQEMLADEIMRVSKERGVMLPVWKMDNRVNKEVRIRRLTPFLSRREIRFKGGSPGTKLLVDQLREFPHGEHDDGPDALEMAIRLADQLLGSQQSDNLPDEIIE